MMSFFDMGVRSAPGQHDDQQSHAATIAAMHSNREPCDERAARRPALSQRASHRNGLAQPS